jgi:hypothetical protein
VVDSRVAVEALIEVDPGFVTLCKTLLGDSVDPQDAWEFIYGPDRVIKMGPEASEVSTWGGRVKGAMKTRRGKLVAAGTATTAALATGEEVVRRRRRKPVNERVITQKADDSTSIVWMGEFSKIDSDKRQVFGYASVVEINGEPVIDRQGDYMSPDELEKAAYDYVVKSRKGGHQHKRDGENPFHASNMIESFVITPEKIEKMGLPEDTPVGWWVGYKVDDEETWQKVKKREVTGFSIHGKGKRVEMDPSELVGM